MTDRLTGRWLKGTDPTHLYIGHRSAMLAEIGQHLDIYQGKYLVYPADCVSGNNASTFDAEGASNKKQLADLVRFYREAYPNIEVVWL